MISVGESLDRYIEQLHTEREPDGMWHPSSLGLCARQAVYGRRGVPKTEPTTIQSKRNFFQGHSIHDLVQAALHDDPRIPVVYDEVALNENPFGIAGSADAVYRDDEDFWTILEFKTQGNKFYQLKGPEPHHVIQAGAYAWILRDYGGVSTRDKMTIQVPALGPGLRVIRFAYLLKNTLETKEFLVSPSDAIQEAMDRLELVEMYEDKGELPPRLPLKRNKEGAMERAWPCRYCEWASECWVV